MSPLPTLPAKQTIDLLALLDPVQDRMFEAKSVGANEWTRARGGPLIFTGADGKAGKIAAPVSLRGVRDYEISFAVANAAGMRSMDVPLSLNNRATYEFTPGGAINLLHQVYPEVVGAWPAGAEATARMAIRVRSEADGMNAVITITVGDQPAGTWRGNIGGIGRPGEFHPSFPGEIQPAFFTYGPRKYTEWTLRVFEGEAKILRSAGGAGIAPAPRPSAPPPEPWQDALARPGELELNKARVTPAGLELMPEGSATLKASQNHPDGAVRFTTVYHAQTRGPVIRARAGSAFAESRYTLAVRETAELVLDLYDARQKHSRVLAHQPIPADLQAGKEYTLELRVIGTKLSARLNGRVLLSAEDESVPSGMFGISAAKESASLRQLEYLVLDATSPAAPKNVALP